MNDATSEDKSLSAHAHWFLYSTQTLSLQVFREKNYLHSQDGKPNWNWWKGPKNKITRSIY